jgi:hypothetical protein
LALSCLAPLPAASAEGAGRFVRNGSSIQAFGKSGAATEASCVAPALEVDIITVNLTASPPEPVLVFTDPNPPAMVTGYNIYRSTDPAAPVGSWSLLDVNASDEDPSTGEVEWTDATGDVSPTGLFFYLVAAYNGPCATEGPWLSPVENDGDRDGVEDDEDPCPGTPLGTNPLIPGCAVTDLMLWPEVLVHPTGMGIQDVLDALSDVTPPDALLANLAEAQLSLSSVRSEMHGAMPCNAETAFGDALDFLSAAMMAIQDHLLTLPATGGEPPLEGTAGDPYAGTEGPVVWSSDEYRFWQGQLLKLNLVFGDATQAAATTTEVCGAEGGISNVEGTIFKISDGEVQVEMSGGERVRISREVLLQGGGELLEDSEVSMQVTDYGNEKIGTAFTLNPSTLPFLGGLTYDNCLQLKILPVQPLPNYPNRDSSWEVHDLNGYIEGGQLELVEGTQLMAVDNGCPGIIPGGGPGGEDMRLDYFYDLTMDYQPPVGDAVWGLHLGYEIDGDSNPIHLPEVFPETLNNLYVKKYKRSCLDSGFTLPIIDPGTGNVVGTRPVFHCSPAQQIGTTDLHVTRIGPPNRFCVADYSQKVFDIEDDEPWDWRETSVNSVWTDPVLAPGTPLFAAFGDKQSGGIISHNQPVAFGESFVIYNLFGHAHASHGTNARAFLDWPHVSGTRNGFDYRYSCGTPPLTTDAIVTCPAYPPTLYRMPFPNGYATHVGQGNGFLIAGGPDSHDGWQQFALDLGGSEGHALKAARGGVVVAKRENMTMNCKTNECEDNGMCTFGFPTPDEYGNYIAIQHVDRSVSWYAHMLPYSAAVNLGQKVMRGEYLGDMGNTGNSCGAHVHFHVTPADPGTWGSTTILVRYEAYDVLASELQTCMIPQEGRVYSSTNAP